MEGEMYADEMSEDEVESDDSDMDSDSDMDCDVLMQYKRGTRIHEISDSECSSIEEEPIIEWKKLDPKRNVEMFIGESGVKVFPNDSRHVSEIAGLFIGDDFIKMIVTETNRYYDQMHRRYKSANKTKKWTNVTELEMKKFLALNILMGQVQKPSIHDYWSTRPSTATPFFSKVMSRNRFLQILRFLHFSNNVEMPSDPNRLFKVEPIIDYFKNKFNTVYKPERELSLDECMIPHRGRLSFRVYNPSKMTKYGILVRELCEARSGYICNFHIFCGKGERLEDTISLLLNKNENVWHHVYMDNYYNNVSIAENLLKKKIRICGTIRRNRGFPKELENKKLKRGEFDFRRKADVLTLKWKDKRDVRMISTIHNSDMVDTNKLNKKTGQNIYKPECIVKYNEYMKGVDRADQYLSYYSFLRKSIKWTKKVFMFLVHCALFNSYTVYRKLNPHSDTSFYKYLQTLSEEWIACDSDNHQGNLPSTSSAGEARTPHDDPPHRCSGNMKKHQLERIPQLGKRRYPQKRCRVCKVHGKRTDTSFICKTCNVPLCKVYCFARYHTKQVY